VELHSARTDISGLEHNSSSQRTLDLQRIIHGVRRLEIWIEAGARLHRPFLTQNDWDQVFVINRKFQTVLCRFCPAECHRYRQIRTPVGRRFKTRTIEAGKIDAEAAAYYKVTSIIDGISEAKARAEVDSVIFEWPLRVAHGPPCEVHGIEQAAEVV